MSPLQNLLMCLVFLVGSAPARALEPEVIPDILKPWIPWVLSDQPQHQCPFFAQDFQQKRCSWPGLLKLDLESTQGRFSGEWTLYQPDWLILPGDTQHWPQHVLVNQKPAVVIDQQGKPAIWAPAGHYQLSGEFHWDSLPESLAIASDTGLIQLSLDHKPVHYPRIDQGSLWLKSVQNLENNAAKDSLDLQVFRLVMDDNPLQLVTQLEINVSGKAREISLSHALLPGFIPVKLDSPLPARIETDGRLLLQVRPGRWIVSIHARHPQPLTQLDLSINDSAWPEAEIWVFQPMPALRLVEIENLPAIDASQTNLPAEWGHLPAYRIKQGQRMGFKLIRRGDPEPEPNQLRLQRKLWLDFDGQGYSISDRISGKMTRDWRLNALTETQLGQVLLNGRNHLITQQGDKQQGVEVRRGDIQLQADSRITSTIGQLNAVGWRQSFQQVQAELNIPPGWRLLAVSGVDNDPDSWLTRWTLLDLFLVLIAALAIARLWSWQWGLVALLSLALFWHEADAPRWIWLNTLAALALVRVWPENRFLPWVKGYRNLCWLSLVLIVIPFMVAQIRIGLYPQLERPWQPIQPTPYADSVVADVEMTTGGMPEEMLASPAPSAAKLSRNMLKAYPAALDSAESAVNFDRIDPEANLQTGLGLPQWQWQTVQLSWNGVVDSQQQIHFWYLSPTWNLLLHIFQVLLVTLMSLKILGALQTPWKLSLPTLTAWLLAPLLLLPMPDSMADIPDQVMLDQLKAHLSQPPKCLPDCAEIASMKITSDIAEMRIELEIHAQQTLAVPLPAQQNQWLPEQVEVDGKPAQGLVRQDDGLLWLVLAQGVHKVQLQGHHGQQYKFSLPLPLIPQHSELAITGWQVEGLYENGKTAEQLQFTQLNVERKNAEQLSQQSDLPAFVRIERTLHLGLDWLVTTKVVRLANNDIPVILKVPLLPGEAVTSEQIRVENGQVLINMAAGTAELEWQSILEKREQMDLRASDTSQWSEVWRADISPIWHLQASGIAAVHHQDQQGAWLPEWRPWPGESVSLHISRPQPVSGPTLTVDKTQLRVQPGKRSQLADLTLNIRSSKGGQHTLTLPAQAILQSVSIDGVTQPIRQKADSVTLPIRPGAQQVMLNWQTPDAQATIMHTPSVNLGVESVNSHIQLISAQDRWLLLTFGPNFGPAVLIWGLLVVLLILAIGLGRVRVTPLKSWQWFLLLIGLSQIHIAAGLLVVLWLFALGLRARQSPENATSFNVLQIALGGLTITSVMLLFVAVQQGLLGTPDMQITGNQSTLWDLKWYQDHSGPILPSATVVSVPMTVYRLAMLSWSLWMALSLLDWLRWGWGCFNSSGMWKKPLNQPKPAKNQT